MVCIQCGAETQVINSRLQKRRNQVWRRRKCLQCLAIFTTNEVAQYDDVWLVKTAKGKLGPFSRDKLFLSLYGSCQHRPTALADTSGLTDTVIAKLGPLTASGVLTAAAITRVAQVALNRFDKAASIHYQAFHKG